MFFFSFYGLQGIGHYAAWRRALSLPPGLGNIDIIGHRGVVVKQAQIIRVSSIILDSTCNQTGESTVSPKLLSVSPAAATRKYYKGRKGPMLREHTSLTFTQKYYHPTIQIFSAVEFFFGGKLPATHTVQT